jgi:hypothetical protein
LRLLVPLQVATPIDAPVLKHIALSILLTEQQSRRFTSSKG